MILLQIIISRPYQQAEGFKKNPHEKPKSCKKETHSFSKTVHDLWSNCSRTVWGFLNIHIYLKQKRGNLD